MREDRFSTCYNMHVDMVYRICFMFLKSKDEAMDGVQEVFIKLHACTKEFVDDEHVKAWLITTARNYCKTQLSYWYHSKRVTMDDINEPSFIEPKNKELLDLVLGLPSKLKLVIYLHYYEGYKTSEIAERLSLNENTIKSQLVKARSLLKEKMGEMIYEI